MVARRPTRNRIKSFVEVNFPRISAYGVWEASNEKNPESVTRRRGERGGVPRKGRFPLRALRVLRVSNPTARRLVSHTRGPGLLDADFEGLMGNTSLMPPPFI